MLGYVIASAFFTLLDAVLGDVVAGKYGITQYNALVIAGIAFITWVLVGYPDLLIIIVLVLFGIAKLIGNYGFLINPTLIGGGAT